jgi:hypothetical protein
MATRSAEPGYLRFVDDTVLHLNLNMAVNPIIMAGLKYLLLDNKSCSPSSINHFCITSIIETGYL